MPLTVVSRWEGRTELTGTLTTGHTASDGFETGGGHETHASLSNHRPAVVTVVTVVIVVIVCD